MKKFLTFSLISILFASCSTNKDYLPEEFWGLKLNRKLTGNEAKDFVDRLHFQNVATEKNEIGFYTGAVGNAIIYLTYYSNEKTAEEDFRKMAEKISPENSVFVNGKFETVDGNQVYSCVGMGQVHYVFYHKNLLFWLSADPNFSRQFFEEYLSFVKR
jgi:hypothetical protein